MRNPQLPKIVTFVKIVRFQKKVTLFWPHENVNIMSEHTLYNLYIDN